MLKRPSASVDDPMRISAMYTEAASMGLPVLASVTCPVNVLLTVLNLSRARAFPWAMEVLMKPGVPASASKTEIRIRMDEMFSC